MSQRQEAGEQSKSDKGGGRTRMRADPRTRIRIEAGTEMVVRAKVRT
jgi:hypothetical protein